MDTKKTSSNYGEIKNNLLFLSGNIEKLQSITMLLMSNDNVKNNKILLGAISTNYLLLSESENLIQKLENLIKN